MTINSLLKRNAGLLTLGITFSLLSTSTTLLLPMLVSKLFSAVKEGRFGEPIALLILAIMATAILTATTMYTTSIAADRSVRDLRKKITSHVLHLRLSEFEKEGSGGFTTRVTSDTSVVSTAASSTLVDFLGGITVIIGSLVYMAIVDWKLLAIVIIVLSTTLTIIGIVSSSIQSLSSKVQEHLAELGNILQSALSAFRTIKAFRYESNVANSLSIEIDHAYENRRKMSLVEAVLDPLSTVASYIALIAVALFGSMRLNNGDITAEALTTFTTALFLILAPIAQVTQSFGAFFEARGALARIDRLLSLKVEDLDKPAPMHNSEICSPKGIEFDCVSYRRDGEKILDNISTTIQPGEKVALTGVSGSGKSTIFSLLLNLYDTPTGHIRVGGVDLEDWNKKELRTLVTYVEQEPNLLPGSLRENLILGAQQLPTDRTLTSLLEQFGLNQFANPDGLRREVGFSNSGLSGGERQRVAIIRAILQQSSVILVDEPTSALDSTSAKQTMNGLLKTDATVIFTSHDEEIVNLAERSLSLKNGKLLENT